MLLCCYDNGIPALSVFVRIKLGMRKKVEGFIPQHYISSNLAGIFNACLKFAYTAKDWQEAWIAFIPKLGKANYAIPMSYRPKSLTSFLFEAMEHTIDTMIRSNISYNMLKNKPHAYTLKDVQWNPLYMRAFHIESIFDQKTCIHLQHALILKAHSITSAYIHLSNPQIIFHILRYSRRSCGVHDVSIREQSWSRILSHFMQVTTINNLL